MIQMTREFNKKNKPQLQTEAYQHRWKNLVLSVIFLIVMVGVLLIGYAQRIRFSWESWYVFVVLVSFLILVSFFTVVNYLVIIIRKK